MNRQKFKYKSVFLIICCTLLILIGISFSNIFISNASANTFQVRQVHHRWICNEFGYWMRISRRQAMIFEGNYRRKYNVKRKHIIRIRYRRYLRHKRINTYRHEISRASTMRTKVERDARAGYINGTNKARRYYGLRPLKVNLEDQQIANIRVGQIFNVYFVQHQSSYYAVHGIRMSKAKNDAYRLGYRNFDNLWSGEDCGGIFMGDGNWFNTPYYTPNYDITDGYQMGENLANQQVNYDEAEHNGHRQNILNPRYKYIGVSADYVSNTNQGAIVEDMTN